MDDSPALSTGHFSEKNRKKCVALAHHVTTKHLAVVMLVFNYMRKFGNANVTDDY